MSIERLIDTYARESAGPGHRTGCACPRCLGHRREAMIERLANESLSTALRHAQADEQFGAESAGGPALPAAIAIALEWSPPVSFQAAIGAAAPTHPAKATNCVYAVHKNSDPSKILYIGSATGSSSAQSRLRQHSTKAEATYFTNKKTPRTFTQEGRFHWNLAGMGGRDRAVSWNDQLNRFSVRVGLPTLLDPPRSSRSPSLAVAAEKALHATGISRSNPPSTHRFEQEDADDDADA